MGAEIEAAVSIAVHKALEAELDAVQSTVANAVSQALQQEKGGSFDLKANLNTIVVFTGFCLFERGIWSAWDDFFDTGPWSDVVSIFCGLGIMTAIRIFDIPLAEWRKPKIDV